MPAITVTWDPTAPAGSTAISAGDDAIRIFKTGLTERLRNGGHQMQTAGATADATDGRHCCGESLAAGSSELAGEFTIYDNSTTNPWIVLRDATSAAGATAGNGAAGELFLGARALRSTGIVKGATLSASTSIVPTAVANNGVNDNAVDIGITGTNRFRDLFLSRNTEIGGTLAVTGVATFTAVPVFSAGSSFTTLTSTVQLVTAGVRRAISINTSGPVTLTTANDIVLCGVTGGGYTVNLPTAVGNAGVTFQIFITTGSANLITIDPSGAETIEAAATATLRRFTAGDGYGAEVVSDGSNWHIINRIVA